MPDTRELVTERYHTLLQRGGVPQAHQFRSLKRSLGHWLPDDKNLALLDLGCGDGVLLEFLRSLGYANLSGADLSPENIRICREKKLDGVSLHDALQIQTLPGPAQGWDVIFCMDLLEHIPKERAADFLMDVAARLAPGGHLVVQTLNMAYVCANNVRYGDLTHETGYTEESLRALLSVSAFGKIEIRPHWYATSLRGKMRELYVRCLHRMVYLVEGRIAPRIPTKNLLARARIQSLTGN